MKTKVTVVLVLILSIAILGCDDDNIKAIPVNYDLIDPEFPEAKQEVLETFMEIAQSIKEGEMDQLIDFYAYGPKFT